VTQVRSLSNAEKVQACSQRNLPVSTGNFAPNSHSQSPHVARPSSPGAASTFVTEAPKNTDPFHKKTAGFLISSNVGFLNLGHEALEGGAFVGKIGENLM
jgi:hypothetical protein